ncbi:MAG TPA: DUF2846 domain-containing protein [Anaeromyxobacter sp.]
MRRLASLVVLTLLASACASVPQATPEADRFAKELRTTPGKTNLYVFRDESFGGAVKMSVVLDGRMLGDTAAKTFLLASVDPGSHALVSKTENDARLEFVAEAGKNVYVWQEVKMGLWAARSELQLVDEANARARIEQCSLALGELMPPLPQASAPAPTPAKVPAAIPGT